MQTLTVEQLRVATDAGGIAGVTVKAQGGGFFVQIATRNGEAILAKARSTEPRRFGNPFQAIALLREIGIMVGTFDVTLWNPAQKETARARPDRSEAMKRTHEAASHDAWFRSQVMQAMAEGEDPATEWVPHEEVLADMQRQREAIKVGMGQAS